MYTIQVVLVTRVPTEGMAYTNACVLLEKKSLFNRRQSYSIQVGRFPEYLRIII